MIDETIKQLEDLIKNKIPLSPSGWLDIIGRIVVEMGECTDKLYSLQKTVAQKKAELIKQGDSVAKAEELVKATDLYEEMMQQKAFCYRIDKLISIGKQQSRLKENEFSGSNL